MCGIAGILHAPNLRHEEAIKAVELMCDHMDARGPDASGIFFDDGLVLGHRRLSILDLNPRSNQPLTSTNNNLTIVFNGEIYNYRELRSELQSLGIQFHTDSDTEVLLEMYRVYGREFLPKLKGMFAFAIWDRKRKTLFLARDAYGIKPLYYSFDGKRFIFSSQVKTLQASRLVSSKTELAGLVGFYLWGSVPDPWTCIEGIFGIEAGHYLIVSVSDYSVKILPPKLWHDIRMEWSVQSSVLSRNSLEQQIRVAVTDSVRRHLISDVPVGVFLSGGIDSSVVAAIASQFNSQIEGITIGFREFEGRPEDEVPLASKVAKYLGIKHHTRFITRDEFLTDIPLIQKAMDQISIDGINTWFASKATVERGYKVVLSGIGGDELFAGYTSFSQIPKLDKVGGLTSFFSGRVTKSIINQIARCFDKPKLSDYFNYCNSLEGLYFLKRGLFLPSEISLILGPEKARFGLNRLGSHPSEIKELSVTNRTARVGVLESTQYLRNQLLRDSDWASMSHSLELRAPFVDSTLAHALAKYTSQFSSGIGKHMLANAPLNRMPNFIKSKKKTGFNIPMSNWCSSLFTENTNLKKNVNANSWARQWALILGQTYSE